MDKYWFDPYCAKEMVIRDAIVDVESDDGVFGGDIANRAVECIRVLWQWSAYKETSCFHTGL